MKNYITPNETKGRNDSESIRAAIAEAVRTGGMKVRIPRLNERTGEELWTIEETVSLPSGIEVLVDDAHLVLAEGKFLNMFTIGDPNAPGGNTVEGTARSITLHGRGNAVLDGGVYNGLHEKNSNKDGFPDIYNNTTLLFFNADGLTVENLSLINQRWWAITNIFVRNAVYRNIRFRADFSRKDENGVHYPNEKPRTYNEVYVKNADGIDLRIGCSHFLIENISGFTEDDSVALTALGGGERRRGYIVEGLDTDIHDVKIHNISTESYCANVRLLNDEGNKLYNVEIDGVTSFQELSPSRENCATIRIGDMKYAKQHSSLGDTHHITVRNIVSRQTWAVALCKGLVDSVIENITVLEGKVGVGPYAGYSAELKNCRIANILTVAEGSTAIYESGLNIHD